MNRRKMLVMTAIGLCLGSAALAEGLDRLTSFKSCDEFISLLKAFQPQKQPNIYSRSLSMEDFGEGGADALIVPEKVDLVQEIWRNADYALIFATSHPKTGASRSVVGILIVLGCNNGAWSFQSLKRYETIGRDSELTCELTSASHKPYVAGQGSSPAVITFKRNSGGRGSSESTSWTLRFSEGELLGHQ